MLRDGEESPSANVAHEVQDEGEGEMSGHFGSPPHRIIPQATSGYCLMDDGQECAALDSNGECKVWWVNCAKDNKGIPLRSSRCLETYPNGGELVVLKR